jgi:hypothetical protein
MALALRTHWTTIIDPAPDVFERVHQARRDSVEREERERLEGDRRSSVAAADAAFQQRDFARVVDCSNRSRPS